MPLWEAFEVAFEILNEDQSPLTALAGWELSLAQKQVEARTAQTASRDCILNRKGQSIHVHPAAFWRQLAGCTWFRISR